MASRFFLFSVIMVLASCRLHAQEDAVLTVAESKLYLEPRETAVAVGVVPAHEAVILTGRREGAWIEVRVPGSVSTWIYGDLLRDGEVLAPKVLLRTGPGLSHPGVYEVERGRRLRVLGSEGDWVRVSPPPQAGLWVPASAVGRDGAPSRAADPPPAATARPEIPAASPALAATVASLPTPRIPPAPPPVAAPAISPVRAGSLTPSDPAVRRMTVRPAVPSMPPARASAPPEAAAPVRQLVPRPAFPSAQDVVTFSGVLRPAGVIGTPGKARLRLVRKDSRGQALTVCYVRGDGAEADRFIGQDVVISGTVVQAPGARYPLIDVDSVVPGY